MIEDCFIQFLRLCELRSINQNRLIQSIFWLKFKNEYENTFYLHTNLSHRWRNGQRARLECSRSWVRASVGSNQRHYKISICCFSAKHAALRRKSKDWLARNQNNVSEWSDMSTPRTVFSVSQHYKNPTQRIGLE